MKAAPDERSEQQWALLCSLGRPPSTRGAQAAEQGGQQTRRNTSWVRTQRPLSLISVMSHQGSTSWIGTQAVTKSKVHSSDRARESALPAVTSSRHSSARSDCEDAEQGEGIGDRPQRAQLQVEVQVHVMQPRRKRRCGRIMRLCLLAR